MKEKIIINPEIIKKIIGLDNISKLYIKYYPNSNCAYYWTDKMKVKKHIDIKKVMDLSIYA